MLAESIPLLFLDASTIPCRPRGATMGYDKSSYPKNYPLILKRLLDTPQLLPHESSKEFLQLFASFEDYGKPQNPRSYLAAYQATVLTWEVLRYQHMKIGVLRSHERAALESLLRKIQVRTASKGIGEAVAKSEARDLAAPWFKDPASRLAIMKTIEAAGYPPNAIEVEAFQLALPALAPIERLIVSAQKRLDQFLDELERTAKANARALRVAAEKAIAANTSVRSPASMK
jgi:hypothetical protein